MLFPSYARGNLLLDYFNERDTLCNHVTLDEPNGYTGYLNKTVHTINVIS